MPDWDKLSADEKKIAIRYQEIFAAFAEETDYEIGRVIQAIDDIGAMDNTLIIYVTGDNGASPNGGRLGVFNTLSTFNQFPETLQYQLETLDEVGGPHSAMTVPAGWSIEQTIRRLPFRNSIRNTVASRMVQLFAGRK